MKQRERKMLKILSIMVFIMVQPLFADHEMVIQQAQQARSRAYCPYSNYSVGAALVTTSGEIIQGCNVENASYGMTCCAERSAVFAAVSQGKQNFKTLVVATRDGGTPCGACRQVLNEFNPTLEIITVDGNGKITHQTTLEKLLPTAFGPHNLE